MCVIGKFWKVNLQMSLWRGKNIEWLQWQECTVYCLYWSPIPLLSLCTVASTDPCDELHCTEAEVCGESYGIYGCLCNKSVCDENNVQSNPQTFGKTSSSEMSLTSCMYFGIRDFEHPYCLSLSGLVVECHNSSGWVSLSRCLLSEAGFPADVLHLNDPECAGTVRDGRVQFHFNNDDKKCGTLLKVRSKKKKKFTHARVVHLCSSNTWNIQWAQALTSLMGFVVFWKFWKFLFNGTQRGVKY